MNITLSIDEAVVKKVPKIAIGKRGTLVISVQVLGEFFSTITKRIPNPLSAEEAETVSPVGTP